MKGLSDTFEGYGCEYEWRVVYGSSCGAANGQVWESGEHHLDCLHVGEYHEQGFLLLSWMASSVLTGVSRQDHAWVSYNTSKSAVLQMARSMACELGKKNIRVNSLSPGHIYTSYAQARILEPFS